MAVKNKRRGVPFYYYCYYFLITLYTVKFLKQFIIIDEKLHNKITFVSTFFFFFKASSNTNKCTKICGKMYLKFRVFSVFLLINFEFLFNWTS